MILFIFYYFVWVRWVLYGELHDPFQEFFIGANNSLTVNGSNNGGRAGAGINVWTDIYFLRASMLPSFVPESLAKRILVIGKTINFIQICLLNLPKGSNASTNQSKNAKGGNKQRLTSNKIVYECRSSYHYSKQGAFRWPSAGIYLQ